MKNQVDEQVMLAADNWAKEQHPNDVVEYHIARRHFIAGVDWRDENPQLAFATDPTEAKGVLELLQDEYVQQVGTWKIISRLEEVQRRLTIALDKALWCAENFKADSELWQKRHHEASEEFESLKGNFDFDRAL